MNFADLLQISQETVSRQVDLSGTTPAARILLHSVDAVQHKFEDMHAPQTCDEVRHDEFSEDELKMIAMTCLFSIISICFTSSVAMMMKYNPQLMAHPNKLIFYMCLAEGIIAWQAMISQMSVAKMICYFKLDQLLMTTTFNAMTEAEAILMLRNSNFNFLQFFEFISLALNFFLCLDIVLTMRNPFYPHDRRMKLYLPLAVVLACCGFSLTLSRVSAPAKSDPILTIYDRALFSVSFLTVYIIFAITSVAYAWRINTRPGMSSTVRKEFIKRHFLYVSSYILTWLPYFGFSFFILFATTVNGSDSTYHDLVENERFGDSLWNWFNAYNMACIGTGILMSIVRMREPIFKVIVKKFAYQFFGELLDEDDGKSSGMDSTLLSFLMSSLNIELVHIILTTVSKNTVGTPKSKNSYKVYQAYDHTNKNKFVLDSIEIDDRQSWDIGHVQQSDQAGGVRRSTRRTTLSKKETLQQVLENKLVINEDIEVTEYAPDVFAFLRQKDGYDNQMLMESLDPETNRSMVFKAGESQGKSGSFFFFSKDQKFIIKTMTDSDFDAFQRIQKAYFAHVSRHDNSLLARVYGIYSVRMEDQKPVKLIVMENGMKGISEVLGVFDLKGSMVNRIVKGKNFKPTTTLKDKNLLAMNQEKIWLRFSEKDRRDILKIMRTDVKILSTYNLMDYSLLMGIQNNPDYVPARREFSQGQLDDTMNTNQIRNTSITSNSGEMQFMRQRFEGSRHKFLSRCGRYIYHIGIIDYLQDYNFDKKIENFLKYRLLRHGPGISAVPPPAYADRFLRFMRDHVVIDQKQGAAQNKQFLRVNKSLTESQD